VTEFLAEKNVSPELASTMMKVAPSDPYCAKSYAEVMRAEGHRPYLLGIEHEGRLTACCYGFLIAGRLNSSLRIDSLPAGHADAFCRGLLRFCSELRITQLQLRSSFASETPLPALPGKLERVQRSHDYVLDLENPEWERKLARRHRQSIRLAIKSGAEFRRAPRDAVREHVHLMAHSQQRRRQRGESIEDTLDLELAHAMLLVEKGAGELFQVIAAGKVLSSGLVLRAPTGALYSTAGNSAEGMKLGASQFLVYSMAQLLRSESTRIFTLGATELHCGLSLFKEGFGAVPVPVEEATYYLGSGLRQKLTAGARLLRRR